LRELIRSQLGRVSQEAALNAQATATALLRAGKLTRMRAIEAQMLAAAKAGGIAAPTTASAQIAVAAWAATAAVVALKILVAY